MDPKEVFEFQIKLRKITKDFLNKTKTCFILNCRNKTIKSHSVAKSRLLSKISDSGRVMYFAISDDARSPFEFIPTGKAKATTFPGFCDFHDKIFEVIDNNNYEPGNKEQEFLFCFRALAREYTVRKGMQLQIEECIRGAKKGIPLIPLSPDGLKFMESYLVRYKVGTQELERERVTMNTNLDRKRFWKVETETIEIDGEYPIVASSVFKLEKSPTGRQINKISDLKDIPKPLFFTLFPQDGKTYCGVSWYKKHEDYYKELRHLNKQAEEFKKLIVSNLLTSYVENFAVKPGFWKKMPQETLDSFEKFWGTSSYQSNLPFIIDPNLNLLID